MITAAGSCHIHFAKLESLHALEECEAEPMADVTSGALIWVLPDWLDVMIKAIRS